MMTEAHKYLLSFLLYGNEEAMSLVGYTNNEEEYANYKYIIHPSLNSPLNNPAKTWANFYPEAIEALTQPVSANTDLLSVACFFTSRAEETIVSQRDEHSRFLAQHSVLGKNNHLLIPFIDELSRHLMKQLDLPLPEQGYSAINLTHDVDTLTYYRHLRGALSGIKKGQWKQVWEAWLHRDNDPAWQFPWMRSTDRTLQTAKQIYFIKATDGKGLDRPQYSLRSNDFKTLVRMIIDSGASIGLHASYEAGEDGNRFTKERVRLEKALAKITGKHTTITLNRHHYLRTTSIDNMQLLADSGITDDYSIGFADHVGFRLQTTRPVRWINPLTLELTNLTLHPLLIMDCTLSYEKYMNLTEDEAFYLCEQLFNKTRQNHGELNLLWHNTSFRNTHSSFDHRRLYKNLLCAI